ncbi:MAG: Fic family protein [Candidatus Altiarchaeota archaeon]|nr:Fic family protein [Candidatus Altiarchaeota archaeon]
MVHFSEKEIKGKKYLYALQSVRLSDGTVAKITKRIDRPILTPELQQYFDGKRKDLLKKDALKKYRTDSVFTKQQIEKVEETKVDYKQILKKLTKAQKKDLFDRFTANFTYESNAIEGNSLTLKDVAIILFENKVVEGKDLREIYETRNSRRVVDLILANRFKVTERDIIQMHKMLVDDMDVATGYKKIPNYLVGRRVKTTPPELVEKEMQDLLHWYKSGEKMHPIKKAALFHGRFERIHPFDDGNGRVGRFLINVILINAGYAPVIIRKSQRIAYLKALEAFDNGYTARLERFMLSKYKNTFKNFFQVYLKYI